MFIKCQAHLFINFNKVTNMTINTRLKEARIISKLSQEQMADRLGISFRAYWNYETGKRDLTQENLINLAQMFNFNPTWLLLGNGPMFLPTKNEKLEKYEHAFKERKTFGKRLNYYQAEENLMDDEISKIIDSSEEHVEKLGLDKNEPTLAELRALKSYSGISIDLWVDGELTGDCACANEFLTPEERKMLEFLKKAKENKLI